MKPDEPERWTATRARDPSSAEARYGEAFRIVAAAPLPSDEAFERVRRALQRPVRRTRWFALVLVIAGTASSAVWAMRAIWPRPASPPRVIAPVTAPAPLTASEPPPAPPPPAPEERATRPPRVPQRQHRLARPTPPPVTESALLAQVFRHLRVERDGRAALTRLSEYDRRFPTGHLRPEAAVARAEAERLLRAQR